MAKQKV